MIQIELKHGDKTFVHWIVHFFSAPCCTTLPGGITLLFVCVCVFLTSREVDERILQQCVRSELHALALLRCRLLLLTYVVASQSYREGKVRKLGQVPMYLKNVKK